VKKLIEMLEEFHGNECINKYVSDKGLFLILIFSLTILLTDLQMEISWFF